MTTALSGPLPPRDLRVQLRLPPPQSPPTAGGLAFRVLPALALVTTSPPHQVLSGWADGQQDGPGAQAGGPGTARGTNEPQSGQALGLFLKKSNSTNENNSHIARPSQVTNPDANWQRASSGWPLAGEGGPSLLGADAWRRDLAQRPFCPAVGGDPEGPDARTHLEGRVMMWVEKSNRSRLIFRRFCTSSSSSVTRIRSWSWPPSTL